MSGPSGTSNAECQIEEFLVAEGRPRRRRAAGSRSTTPSAFATAARPRARRTSPTCGQRRTGNLRDSFENGEVDIDPTGDQLAAQLGAIKVRVLDAGQGRKTDATDAHAV